MIKAFSQRLTPPYRGTAQIVETDEARAITMDGESWEVHFIYTSRAGAAQLGAEHNKSFMRVATITHTDFVAMGRSSDYALQDVDARICKLAKHIASISLPLPSADMYEYWLLDKEDDSPIAFLYSCVEPEQMSNFPKDSEWTSLPASAMPIELTPEEKEQQETPVNHRVQQMIAERCGGVLKTRGRWFKRHLDEEIRFPPYLVTEDWTGEQERILLERYLERQSTRLLMLPDLSFDNRRRLEGYAKRYPLEVEHFFPLYPGVADATIMDAIRVEAKIRKAAGES